MKYRTILFIILTALAGLTFIQCIPQKSKLTFKVFQPVDLHERSALIRHVDTISYAMNILSLIEFPDTAVPYKIDMVNRELLVVLYGDCATWVEYNGKYRINGDSVVLMLHATEVEKEVDFPGLFTVFEFSLDMDEVPVDSPIVKLESKLERIDE